MHCVCESLSVIYNSFPFRFGRKKVVFISLAAQCVSVMLQSFSHSWRMFCIMFLFVGASQISIYISAFVLGMNCKIVFLIQCLAEILVSCMNSSFYSFQFDFLTYDCILVYLVSISLLITKHFLFYFILDRNGVVK